MLTYFKEEYHYILCLIVFSLAGLYGLISFKFPTNGLVERPYADDQELGIFYDKKLVTIDDLVTENSNILFTPYREEQITLPGVYKVRCWIRLPLKNNSAENKTYILELASRWVDVASLYIPTQDNRYTFLQYGESRSHRAKEIPSISNAFPIRLDAGEMKICYLLLADSYRVNTGFRLWQDSDQFNSYIRSEEHFVYAYFGLLAGLFITNICVYLAFGYRDVLYYLTYLAAYGTLQLVNFNFHMPILLELLASTHHDLPTSINAFLFRGMFVISAATLILFANEFLGILRISQRLYKCTIYLAMSLLCVGPVLMFGLLNEFGTAVVMIVIISWTTSYIMTLVVAIWAAWNGARQARYFIPAILLLIIVSWRYSVTTITGQVPTSAITLQWLYASGLEMIIFMFGLVDRLIFVNRQRAAAQELALKESHRIADLRKRYSDELRVTVDQRTEDLRGANEKKNRILQILSHDLKTPLNSMKILANMIRRDPQQLTREELHEFAGNISITTGQLTDMVDNLLQWAVTSDKRQAIADFKIYSVKDLLEPVLDSARLAAAQKKINIVTHFPDGVYVRCDYMGITTILRNLIGNAIKFTKSKGTVNITVTSVGVGDKVEFLIIDTGVGMSPELLHSLRKGDVVESQRGTNLETGSGIGLRICREILCQHAGSKLEMWSNKGQGTKISFHLPNGALGMWKK